MTRLGNPGTAATHMRRAQHRLMGAAAVLSILGFLAYYLPVYRFPALFPAFSVTVPFAGLAVRIPWGELVWAVLLTTIELLLLVFLNIVGVHEIAVATGFITPETKAAGADALLAIGLEKPEAEASRYGIDPFEGLNQYVLFLFNAVLRLKGWLGNQALRYLSRLFLGRYAVRSLLDFGGMPLYMAINAYSVYAVMREAKVAIAGGAAIRLFVDRLPRHPMAAEEKALLYDTLQYIAVSRRDFHRNHYLLTQELLEAYAVPVEPRHCLPGDYLEKLRRAPSWVAALCRAVILLGFIADGQLSWRERRRLRRLNRLGVLRETASDLSRWLRGMLDGSGLPPDSFPFPCDAL